MAYFGIFSIGDPLIPSPYLEGQLDRSDGFSYDSAMPKGCDGCTFCCTMQAVDDPKLKKPYLVPCPLSTGTGCSVHGDILRFPKKCADFECGYLVHQLPDEFRPDRCHVMLTGEDEFLQAHCVQVDPAFPYADKTGAGQQLINLILQAGKYPNIIVTTAGTDRIVTRDPLGAHILKIKLNQLRQSQKLEARSKRNK